MQNLAFHDAANLFPLMMGRDFEELKADIERHGVQVPADVMGGKILDGRNRYRACVELGIDCPTAEVSPDDPAAYVVSKNLHRRHLDESQRALIGAKVKDWCAGKAKERQRKGGKDAGKGRPKQVVETFPPPNGKSKARDQAGAAVGVSGKLIDAGARVLKTGTPDVVRAVESGRLPVTVAAKLATLPPAKQQAALAAGKPGIKAAVRAAHEQAKPDWAKGPSPQEEAQNDPARRWNASLHKVYVLLNSTRAAGGIAELSAKWDPDAKADYARELREIVGELETWIELLEGGE